MRIKVVLAIALIAAGTAAAQRHKLPANLDASQEGALLRQITMTSEDAQRVPLLEEFVAKYPAHQGAAWAYEKLITAYEEAKQPDKLIAAGEKLFAIDPADAETGHACLKAALESKRDPDLVLKWAVLTSEAARKMAQLPKPSDESEVADWTKRVDYAKQLDIYTEYCFYAMALQTPDPAKKIALGDALEARNGMSQYLPQIAEQRFLAYLQSGDHSKAVALAERTLARDQSNPEMILAVASSYLAKKQPDAAVDLAGKAIAAVAARPKPEGVDDAAWTARAAQLTARAHFIAGVGNSVAQKWAPADKSLRAALPGLATPEMKAEALFQLGFVNYQLAKAGDKARAVDAVRFSDQCAAITGPYKAPAAKNAREFRKAFGIK